MTSHHNGPLLDLGRDDPRKWFENIPAWANPDYIVFWDDFTGVALDTTNDWTVVEDTASTQAIQADTLGGRLIMTSGATNDEGSSIQGNEIFAAQAGKDIWFEAYISSSDADDQDIYVGLSENFATNPEAVLTASNRIGLQVNDGNASVLCKTEASDTETSTDSGVDLADATLARLGFHVTGTSKVEFFVNRKLVATHTTNIPTANMTPAAFHLAGSANARSLVMDYILCVATR